MSLWRYRHGGDFGFYKLVLPSKDGTEAVVPVFIIRLIALEEAFNHTGISLMTSQEQVKNRCRDSPSNDHVSKSEG